MFVIPSHPLTGHAGPVSIALETGLLEKEAGRCRRGGLEMLPVKLRMSSIAQAAISVIRHIRLRSVVLIWERNLARVERF